ncbi:hypothetical protein [Lactococcus garvieae]
MTYEFIVLDLKNSKNERFNPIENFEYLDLEAKAKLVGILYDAAKPSFFPSSSMTVTNFKIQEYRATLSRNIREFLTKDFKIPVLFPLERKEYEELVLIVAEDCNFYDYSKINQSDKKKKKGK